MAFADWSRAWARTPHLNPRSSVSVPAKGAVIARFFFHTNHPSERGVQDDEGYVFASVHAAKCEAVAYAGRLLADSAQHFWDTGDFELTVTNERGVILFMMRVVGFEADAAKKADEAG